MNIVIIGFRGTGKSTVGKLLAKRLERDFIDSDKYIESSTGKTIKSIFEEDGEEGSQSMTLPLILDGEVQTTHLDMIGKTVFWLRKEMRDRGFKNIQEISFCSFQNGQFYIDEKNH